MHVTTKKEMESMNILGIKNRTENWKTAVYFSPLFGAKSINLVNRLGESPGPATEDVKLELFWKGMRDFLHRDSEKKEPARGQLKEAARGQFVDLYLRLFPDLRTDIEKFGAFRNLKPHNYDVSTDERMAKLFDNLFNTEIDVVLETPDKLFIGEAKHEMGFGANSNLILVHQLMRQYVTATILIEFSNNQKEVVPFVVCDSVKKFLKTSQVRFMISQGWLKEDNVLGWDKVNPSAS